MKKKFTFLLAALLLMSGLTWAQTTINWTAANQGYENQQEITSVDFDANVSGNFAKGTSSNSPKYYTNGTAIRCYGGNTITIVSSDANLTTISITFGSSDGSNAITTDVGTYSDGIWTGDAEEVTFTIGGTSGNRRIAGFAITYGGTPAPITYTVTYDCNGGTSGCPENVTNIEPGTQIQLADAPSRDNYDFDGWSDGTEIYGENEDYTVNGNVTFTAQWTPQSSGDEQWVLTNLADLTESDVFVIVGNNGSTYAMSNDKGTGNPPVAVAVTVTNDVITSTVEESIQWTVSGNATDGYTFYPNGSTTTWLYCTNTNNGVRVGTNNAKTFVINSDYLYHNGTSRHVGIYNSQDWRCYTPQSGAVHNNIAGQTFAFYKKVTDGVVPPTITAANVDLAYDAEGGTINYTINNPVEGGALTAEVTDGYEWISADEDQHTDATGTVALITDANTTTTVRTATVTLTYTYENRETVTKTVTVTQAAAPVIYTTIPALFEAASTETDVTVTFGGWVISAVKNSNAYLTDNAGNGLIIYQSDHGFQVNDVLTGTASCKLLIYRGSAELKNLTATTEGLTVTPNGTVTVQNIAISELSGVNTGALVAYENLTYTDGKLQDSEGNQITPYTTLYDYGNIFVEGHVYNVTGIYLQYNTTKEILPRSADDIEEVTSEEPTITVTPAEFTNVMYEGETLEATVAWENFEGEYLKDFVYYESDGETPVQNTWFEIQGEDEEFEQIYILVEPNDGAARTGYFKAYAVTTDGEYYSNLVTISQEAYSGPVEVLYSYSINGVEGETISYTGESITLDDSDDLEGFNFVGWTLDPNDVDNILYAEDQFTFEDDVTVFYAVYEKAESKRDGGSYVKVTSTDDIENGNYLIVYEDGNVAFDGGLDSFDATENTIEVEITNGQIASSSEVMAAAFTIEEMEGGYSIQGASGKYISVNGFNNGLVSSETPAANAIDFENDNVLITRTFEAGTMTLKFNSASNQLRFRYYKSGQQDIQLYKYTSDVETPTRFTRVFINETVAGNITIVGPSIIPAGQTLDMGENYILENNFGADRLVIEDGGQLYSVMAVEATMQKNINGYANENTASGYYLIATPITVEYNNTAATNLASNTYDLYAYEQSQELEWRNFKNADNDLSYLFPGEGYLYANSETMTLEIRGELTVAMDDVISLAYSDDGLKSLNLVGNPLPHNVTLGAYDAQHNQKTLNFLTMNDAGDGFITTTANQFNAVPMQGFFVQATAEGLHLEQVVTGGTSPGFEEEEFSVGPRMNSLLNITLHNGGNLIDNAIIFFANGSMMNKYYLNENSTRLYIPQGGQELAVVRSNGQGEMPVNFKPAANGNYTINVNMKNVEMDYLHLIDNLTGADIDLIANPSYSFEANTNDYATRFRVVFSADFVANDNDSNFAYFNGSEYVVSNQGQATLQVVDVMGRIISSQTISGNAEVNVNEACGVYMLRLVNGDNVKTQKIVIQ